MPKTRAMNLKNALILSLLLSLFWCLIVFLGYTGTISARIELSRTITDMYADIGRQFVIHCFLFFALFCLQFSVFNKNRTTKWKIGVSIAGSIAIVFVTVSLFGYILMNVIHVNNPNIFFLLAFAIVVTAMTIMLTSLFYITGEREKTIIENQKLLVENMRARYETLKSQINPHFLFNSLNTLNGLIGTDSVKAKEFVHQLSFVFRYSIQNRETATLDDELRCIEAFCNLMKIRYGESLNIAYRIDERYADCLMIPLSLQMLVENAIKHNTISNRNPLTITVETTDNRTVRVYNRIQPKNEDTSGEGIGLANMSERYKMLYQREIAISVANGVFSVEIPLITPSRHCEERSNLK